MGREIVGALCCKSPTPFEEQEGQADGVATGLDAIHDPDLQSDCQSCVYLRDGLCSFLQNVSAPPSSSTTFLADSTQRRENRVKASGHINAIPLGCLRD